MGVTITGQWVSGEQDNGCQENWTMGVTIAGQWVSGELENWTMGVR